VITIASVQKTKGCDFFVLLLKNTAETVFAAIFEGRKKAVK
jgi:hypothetical protein